MNGRTLYVVIAFDVYADPGNGDGPDGCTMRHLDLMLRPTLERLGRWSGRGPAMVPDPPTNGPGAAVPWRGHEWAFIRAALHLAHRAAALRERGELVKRAERDEDTADRLQAGIVPFTSTARVDYWREQAGRHRKAGKDALAALATVQKEIAKLEREEAAIFERMTKP